MPHVGSNGVIKMTFKTEPTQTIPEALKNFTLLPDNGFIRLPVVMRLYGISSASIWRGIKNGTIPKPVKITERTTAWSVKLVREDLASKAGV